MRIYVIGAVLGVVFDDKNSSVIPVRAVSYSFDDSANGEVVVGDRS